ncbi:hypothetical protein [Sphingorhabdus sp.]|uniref:hypothetical protein n=1 Tax=Sphingorhabdus sp. TaxID=1902408 RepID=UPI003BAEC5DE
MKKMLIIATVIATPVVAKNTKPAEVPPAVEALRACSSIAEQDQRLACYDDASAKLLAAQSSGELVMLDKPAVKKARRSLFGFSLPDLPFFDGDDSDKEEPVDEITSTFASFRALGMGKWQFTLPEGGTWQSTEALTSIPREGQAMMIKRGIAGGYMLKIGKGPLRRVKRID